MKNFVLIILTISAFFVDGFSQSNQNAAPVKWEKYKNSNKKLTVMFPKLPVKTSFDDVCSQQNTTIYYAYAEEVVYKLVIVEKSKEKFSPFCTKKVKFTEKSFSDYKDEVESAFAKMERSERNGKTYLKAEKNVDSLKISKWLLNDYQNFRWFEFTVSKREYIESKEKDFVDSLSAAAELSAIEISDGASVILGDEWTAEEKIEDEKKKEKAIKLTQATESGEKIVDVHSSPLTIIFKMKPRYTDEARKSNLTGNVRLRVTFLPNGAIGNISTESELGYGLTEQAIIAARKMAFLPQKQYDWNVPVTKVVVFNFSIY